MLNGLKNNELNINTRLFIFTKSNVLKVNTPFKRIERKKEIKLNQHLTQLILYPFLYPLVNFIQLTLLGTTQYNNLENYSKYNKNNAHKYIFNINLIPKYSNSIQNFIALLVLIAFVSKIVISISYINK